MANPYFNATYYLANNPDVFAAGINTAEGAWQHYVQYGAKEALNGAASRSPAPWFDIEYYLKSNPDLTVAGLDAGQLFDHFVNYGIEENRQPSAGANVNAETLAAYAAANADLREAFGIEEGEELTDAQLLQLAQHYYAYGYNEKREGKPAEYEPEDPNTGETFTLTTGIDVFNVANGKATNGDDTYVAGEVGTTATLNAGDQIDAGAGTDTIKIYGNSGAANFGQAVIKNVEIVENYGASAINASNNADVQQVWQIGATGNVTASLAQTVGFSGNVGTVSATFNGANTTSNAATMALRDAGTAAAGAAITVATTPAGVATIENLTVQAAGKNVVTSITDADLRTLTITGEGSIGGASGAATTISAGTNNLGKIDASANSGGVNLSVSNTNIIAAGLVATGGSGKDGITFSNALTKKATVDLGAGDDSLTITQATTAFAAGSTFNGGEGTDTLVLSGTTTAIDATTGKMFTGFETVKLTGASSYNAGHIAGVTGYELGANAAAAGATPAETSSFTNLASGSDVLVSAAQAGTTDLQLNGAGAANPAGAVDLVFNGGTTAATIASLTTNARVLNVTSEGTATATNSLVIAATQSVTAVTLGGAHEFSLTTGANAIGSIDGGAATGKLTVNAAGSTGATVGTAQTVYITTGSGADVITAATGSGVTAVKNVVVGGLGADVVTLGATAANNAGDVIKLTSQADSNAAGFDVVKGFSAATGVTADKIDITSFNLNSAIRKAVVDNTKATVAVDGTSDATLLASTFTINDAQAAGFFTSGGAQNGVIVVQDSTTAANGAFVFVDADGDGNWNAEADAVILLAGNMATLTAGDHFVFA